MLLSAGDVQGGFSFYVQDGKLHYVYYYVGSQFFHIESNVPVPVGRHKLRFEFEVTGKPDYKNGKGAPGRGQLYIDGKLVGQGDIPLTMPVSLGLCWGYRVRCRHRLAGLGQIRAAIQVHRHALQHDRGRERRDDQRLGSGDAHRTGATVGTLRTGKSKYACRSVSKNSQLEIEQP